MSSKPADPPRLPRKALDELLAIAARARAASDAITRSFTLIEQTSLDIVDMQVRLQGETARLASALRELGERVERQPSCREAFADPLVALDEASQLVAAAVFPSSVQGLRSVNVKLWDFEKLQWKRYTDILSAVVQSGRITLRPAGEDPVDRRRRGPRVRGREHAAQRAGGEPGGRTGRRSASAWTRRPRS